jgi:hypothetical protein
MAIHVRNVRVSRKNQRDSNATTAGKVASVTPAAVAVVSAMPLSMQIENRKFPKNESRKKSHCSVRVSGASPFARNVQGSIATEAMAKRRNASAKTGITATSGLDSPTYVPTSAIEAVSSKYAMNLDDVGAVLMCEATIPDASRRYAYTYTDLFAATPGSTPMMIALLHRQA